MQYIIGLVSLGAPAAAASVLSACACANEEFEARVKVGPSARSILPIFGTGVTYLLALNLAKPARQHVFHRYDVGVFIIRYSHRRSADLRSCPSFLGSKIDRTEL